VTVTFEIWGELPAPWEDFFSRDKAYSSVTLYTRKEAESSGEEEDEDGWRCAVVDAPSIDEAIAKAEIAKLLGIAAEDVVIVSKGLAQSV
jgi:hypothetical protein